MLKGEMFDETSFGLEPAPEINFRFVDNFIFGQDFSMEEIIQITFPNP
jgi:hypothetical protein